MKGRKDKVRQIARYAEFYGVAQRTVKRWNATGRRIGDPPPLADPPALRLWWQRNMKNCPPMGILSAVIAGSVPAPPERVAKPIYRGECFELDMDSPERELGNPPAPFQSNEPPATMSQDLENSDQPIVHHFGPDSAVVEVDPPQAPAENVATGFEFRGVPLSPFPGSRFSLFSQFRVSIGAPPLRLCLADVDAFQADAWRILWICSHGPSDWAKIRSTPAKLQLVIDSWTDSIEDCDTAAVTLLGYQIYADAIESSGRKIDMLPGVRAAV